MKSSLFPGQELKRRTLGWATRLRVNPKVIRVQEMRKKWGSCSSAGTVTLASDLAVQDQRFQDYVIVHELLHLRLSTHGRVFKALMSAHVPGWQAMEQRRLKGRTHRLLPPDDSPAKVGSATTAQFPDNLTVDGRRWVIGEWDG